MKFILDGEWTDLPKDPPLKGAVLERLEYPEYVRFSVYREDIRAACRSMKPPDWLVPRGHGEVLSCVGVLVHNGHETLKYMVLHRPVWTLELASLEELRDVLKELGWCIVGVPEFSDEPCSLGPYSH